MTNLKFKKLQLLSVSEKAAESIEFSPEHNVIRGENGTGKSSLIKSLYAAFGADPYKIHPSWKEAKVNILLDFEFGGMAYRVLRVGESFALFDNNNSLLWSVSGVMRGLAPRIAGLFDFHLQLNDRRNNIVTPPPAYYFLPFYVDQDIGWVKTWSSFSNVQMFSNYKRDAAFYHVGIRPNEYYIARGEKLAADVRLEELKLDRRALDRAHARLLGGKKGTGPDLKPGLVKEKIDAVLAKYKSLCDSVFGIQVELTKLHSQKVLIEEQAAIARASLNELEKDFVFVEDLAEEIVTCPTCGTVHENNFANKFAIGSDLELCASVLSEANGLLVANKIEIETEKLRFNELMSQIQMIEADLNVPQGDVTLADVIRNESERVIDNKLQDERNSIDMLIGSEVARIDAASERMKRFDNRKAKVEIRKKYRNHMQMFCEQLNVGDLPQKCYSDVDCTINETGSDLPRAVLAYYYAFLHTMTAFSSTARCPIVIDSPVQQDQDAENAARVIQFIVNNVPPGAQLILGTVQLHGVEYSGHVIEMESEQKLLKEDKFDDVRDQMAPLLSQMFN